MNNVVIARKLKATAMRAAWTLPYETRRRVFRRASPGLRTAFDDMRAYNMGEAEGLKVSLKRPDDYKCIFVHIPKCAGISIGRALFGDTYNGNHMGIPSYQLIYSKEEFESFFKFTFVRNPWDRLVSGYRFLKEISDLRAAGAMDATQANRKSAVHEVGQYGDFGVFVKEWLTPTNADMWEHFRPQSQFVCTPSGDMPIDYVARYERVAEDFAHIANKLGVTTELVHHNRSGGESKPYQSYYDAESKAVVAEIYKRDIELFGYSFDD